MPSIMSIKCLDVNDHYQLKARCAELYYKNEMYYKKSEKII